MSSRSWAYERSPSRRRTGTPVGRSDAAAPSSTNTTSFSPATTPSPMRIASFARWDARGSVEIRTMTGGLAVTESVERDEPIGGVDQIGQDDEAAVRHGVRIAQRDTPLLAAVGADEQLRAALRQRADARILERAHPVVDEIQIEISPAVERRAREAHRRLEIGMLEPGGQQHAELLLCEIHRGSSVASE